MKTFASTVFINVWFLAVSALGQAPNNILHGEVTQDGKPISGAIVSIYQLTQEGYAKTIVSNTNDEGKYLFPKLPKGDYAIIINKGDTRLYQEMISIGQSKITDHRKIACDGNSVVVEKQTVSCKFTAPNVIEGESSPPLQYSRSEIVDGRLTIGIFKDTKRRKPDEKYVYDKAE